MVCGLHLLVYEDWRYFSVDVEILFVFVRPAFCYACVGMPLYILVYEAVSCYMRP
jgi:hypothetical protein